MEKLKLILITLSYAIVFGGGYYLRQHGEVPCPAPSLQASAEKQQSTSSHIVGTIKKKDAKIGASGEVINPAETEINFDAEISSLLNQKSSISVIPAVQEKPDNIKFPLNSKLQTGVEFMPVKHHWLGYLRDFHTSENIYQYSYSTRLELPWQ